jgi:hypothetical protein
MTLIFPNAAAQAIVTSLVQDLRTTVTQVTILRGEFNFWLI